NAADRFEAESRAFHEALREAYLLLARTEPGRCLLIDATEPKGTVAERIWKYVSERLDPVSAPALRAGAAS
ncbi:MAG: dTMP kinase, partial [Xanthobacteraceae bacterium]